MEATLERGEENITACGLLFHCRNLFHTGNSSLLDLEMSDTDFEFGANTQEGSDCGGTVECSVCGKFHGWCNELDKLKENKMIPSSGEAGSTGRRGGTSNRLTAADLSKEPRDAKILAARYEAEGKFGKPQVIVKMAINGTIRFWYLDMKKNPNLQLLIEQFGKNENDWAGERILMGLEEDPFHDTWYPRVSFPEKDKEAATPRRRN